MGYLDDNGLSRLWNKIKEYIGASITVGTRKSGSKTGGSSLSVGANNTASGPYSAAIGRDNISTQRGSMAVGMECQAIGDRGALAQGWGTIANIMGSFASGSYNKQLSADSVNRDIFALGNGTSDTARSNAFRVTVKGMTYTASSYNSYGADYAEYFEWEDGNLNAEDRIGLFVTLSNGSKIQKAEEGEPILGIVSGNPCVVGNSDEEWIRRFKRDNFGRYIMQEIEVADPETGEITKDITYVQNPDYNPDCEYVPRLERKEWDTVGMLGVIPVRDDGTCQINEYCKCTYGGIATAVDKYEIGTYRVIERVAENIVKVVLK